jgi:polyhydroxyalkanoate synthesis repressor PhaR
MTVLIKRYANRKLYNTETSRYITLRGIAELVEQEREVRVIDNESGEDITSTTLSQILADSGREGRPVPQTLLSDLIQRGSDALYGALRKGLDDAGEGLGDLQRNFKRLVSIKEGGADPDWIAVASPDFENLVQKSMERAVQSLGLPSRADLDALNQNLTRVAAALEALAHAGTPPAATDPAPAESASREPSPRVRTS